MAEFLKILTVILFCSLFFSKLGMPAAVILFKFNFIKVFIVSCVGGIGGTIFYVYLSAAILKWWDNYKEKKQIFNKKKIFTKGNRRIIKIKNRFGLTGIAILTPVLLSIPLGAFVAERFYKDKRKVITQISIWVIIWSIVFYCIYYFFYDNLKGWFI
ncbi:MAG: hypothetical protein K0S32_541 [Bacteroidetes bacterium]|nr:hypothetical protein [Bacteroidota bacterium]